jgi:hypothetical protein
MKLLTGCSADGSAREWGSRGRKFDSCHSDHKKPVTFEGYGLLH